MSARTTMLVSALAFTGCFGTETGNPPLAPATMALRTSDPTVASIQPNAGVDVVEEAWISIASIYALQGARCDSVDAVPVLSEVSGDLASGIPTDGLRAGTSCGLYVVPSLAVDPIGAPPGFDGRAIFVRGTRADGTPFEIASDTTAGISLFAPSGVLALAEDGSVILALDAASWLGGLDLSTVVPDADGVARIEPGEAMHGTFDLGVAQSFELFEDPNGDGALDPAEEAAGPIAQSHP